MRQSTHQCSTSNPARASSSPKPPVCPTVMPFTDSLKVNLLQDRICALQTPYLPKHYHRRAIEALKRHRLFSAWLRELSTHLIPITSIWLNMRLLHRQAFIADDQAGSLVVKILRAVTRESGNELGDFQVKTWIVTFHRLSLSGKHISHNFWNI